LDYIYAVSAMSVQRKLKKKRISTSPKEVLANPPESCAAFVATMEDLLEVYPRPYDENRPVICMDESNKQLVSEVKSPIPCEPGYALRVDDEYIRNGVADDFMAVEPLIVSQQCSNVVFCLLRAKGKCLETRAKWRSR
jgi:hypothetical protein